MSAATETRCRACGSADLVVVIDGQSIARTLASIIVRLNRIEKAITQQGDLIMAQINDELDAVLDDLTAKIGAVDADLSRELADFVAAVAPKLTADEQAKLGAIAQKLTDFTASIDQADVPPAPPA